MSSKGKGNGRACIGNAAAHVKMRYGERPSRFNPGFQVAGQNEPTDADPVRRHIKQARPKS